MVHSSLSIKSLLGLVLAAIGFLAPILIEMPGLDLPGRLALGIFLMAALLWVFESVPIWATSLLVIFLQVMLLSNVSPIMTHSGTPATAALADGSITLPASALSAEGKVYVEQSPGKFRAVPVSPESAQDETITLEAGTFAEGTLVAENASHWTLHFEVPRYTQYYNSLAHPIVILFLGGFFLAAAAVKYGLDQNLTSIMLRIFGQRPAYVLLGLLLSTALLSAFMSNTASSAMMITMVIPIIRQLKPGDPLRYSAILAIPCGANIGGVATPIGTPPNAVVLGALANQGIHIGFLEWMMIAVPLVILVLFVTWRALLWLFKPQSDRLDLDIPTRWDTSPRAIGACAIFAMTVLLWVTDQLHGIPAPVIAFLPIALMPLLGILDKADIKTFSWDVLWLMAGGLSLGIAMQMGPAEWLIGLINWSTLPPFLILLAMGVVAYTFSNLISNTVAAAIIIPIAVSMGVTGAGGEGFDFVKTAVTIGIMVSFSMLLPISTPPNAIASATGILETRHLTRIGIVVGLVGFAGAILMGWLYWSNFLEARIIP